MKLRVGSLLGSFSLVATLSWAAPIINGSIGSEGWVHLTESPYGRPVVGGSALDSDLAAETSGSHRWDGTANAGAGADVNLGANRGNVHNLFVQWDANNLYLAVEGPTVPFINWNGPNGSSTGDDGDQGDLYIAMDIAGGAASGFLTAADAHRTFHNASNPQAVDFEGWRPTHFVGVEWVNNSDFVTPGQGWANIEESGTHNILAGTGQNQVNNGFQWAVGYDGNGRGVYEMAIAWSTLGLGGIPFRDFRFAMYTTYNDDFHDTYDSGPGLGQGPGGVYEEIGDFPGDRDTGTGDDGLFAGTANANGVPAGSFPGSNFVDPNTYNYGAAPNRGDEIDTISEYLTIAVVPEPGTLALMGLGLVGAVAVRRRSLGKNPSSP